jgi:hypothetical protein
LQRLIVFLIEEEAQFCATLHFFEQQYQCPQELLDHAEAIRQNFEEIWHRLLGQSEVLTSETTGSEVPNNTTAPEAANSTTEAEAPSDAADPNNTTASGAIEQHHGYPH